MGYIGTYHVKTTTKSTQIVFHYSRSCSKLLYPRYLLQW